MQLISVFLISYDLTFPPTAYSYFCDRIIITYLPQCKNHTLAVIYRFNTFLALKNQLNILIINA